jgi:hypothetical protein
MLHCIALQKQFPKFRAVHETHGGVKKFMQILCILLKLLNPIGYRFSVAFQSIRYKAHDFENIHAIALSKT